MHEVFKTQVKKILDSHTDNSFQFIMDETIEFYNNGKIEAEELEAFFHIARIVNPISFLLHLKKQVRKLDKNKWRIKNETLA